jgi:phage shock protein C
MATQPKRAGGAAAAKKAAAKRTPVKRAPARTAADAASEPAPPPPPPPALAPPAGSAATSPSTAAPAASPRLTRSRTDRVLGGVAGGIGRHLGVDPIIVRLVFVVLVLAGGSGILAYLIAWVVIPDEPEGSEPTPAAARSSDAAPRIAGLGLIALGALLLAERLLPGFSWRFVAPLLLIALGALLLVRSGASR